MDAEETHPGYTSPTGGLHHFLVTEGGADKQEQFHKVSYFNDPLLCRFFTREVFSLLLCKKLIHQNLVQKILHWRHTGFNVHSKVRTESKDETEHVGKYMIRPILSPLWIFC